MLGVCSSPKDQQFWLLNRMISSSYEKDMTKILKLKLKNFCRILKVFLKIFNTCGGKEKCLKRRERRDFQANQQGPRHPPHGGRVGLTGLERVFGRGAHGLPHDVAHVASWPLSPLSRTLTFFSRNLGIRTLILNPFSDYEPWLPHARRRLHKFEKWLRNHLRNRRWSQLNEWEWKVV